MSGESDLMVMVVILAITLIVCFNVTLILSYRKGQVVSSPEQLCDPPGTTRVTSSHFTIFVISFLFPGTDFVFH